jgi:hypothetical protein
MLDERPQLDEFQAYYFEAFADLNTCRGPAAQGVGPIPWLAAMAYCDQRGVDDVDDRAELWVYVRAMDSVFTGFVQDKIKESMADR